MARSKRHHYVPQALQKHFCNEAGQVWYAKRASLSETFSKIEPRNTKSAFQERDFYTVLSETYKPSDEVATIVPEGKASFILGSRMIYRISNGTNDPLGSVNVELWFPITPKICLVLHALGEKIQKPIIWPSGKIREVNEYIVSRCHEVATHSDRLLISLLRQNQP